MEKNEKKLPKFFKREFLNKPGYESIGSIQINISHGYDSYNFSEIMISDCARSITLNLCFDNEGEIANSIHKISVLEQACKEAREFIETNVDIIREENKKEHEQAKGESG